MTDYDDGRLTWLDVLFLWLVDGCGYVVDALVWCWRRVRGHGPIPDTREDDGKNPYR